MQENIPLQAFNTFGLQASARWYCVVETLSQLQEALRSAREKDLPLFVLGGGSNILLPEQVPGLTLHMRMKGIHLRDVLGDQVLVEAACGENWHAFVGHCLAQGWHGLENLALIPGSVGAAPIQNIGAYGVEVGERIASVTVLNTASGEVETIGAEQCAFAYRDSVFKRQYKGNRIILSVLFRLQRSPMVNLSYGTLAQALASTPLPQPADVHAAVCAIRRSRLPDPAVLGNAGSFFKNPVVSGSCYAALQALYPDIPGHPVAGGEDAQVKVPAAWLIEQTGWKGRRLGQAGVYEKQPLVLVNHGGARAQEILDLARRIMADVDRTFAIRLEPEVQWVSENPPQ